MANKKVKAYLEVKLNSAQSGVAASLKSVKKGDKVALEVIAVENGVVKLNLVKI